MKSRGKTKKNLSRWSRSAVTSVWFFPGVVVALLLLMTGLRISGSSIGVYSQLNGKPDSAELFADPRGVRSDEWLVTTQMTIAQANNDFKKINDDIGNGQNMSFIDVPYRDWSTAFKPQNISFFVLPLEFAFAFKWWFMFVVLLLACYFFVLELFPKKILRAAAVALLVGLTPMVFWWYANGIILTLAYSFLIALFAIRLIKARTVQTRLGFSAALSYTLICYGLILYPPFQLPCLLATALFVVGWSATYLDKELVRLKRLAALWPYALLCIIIPIGTGLAFYQDNKEAVRLTTHTVYPGTRVIVSGGTDPLLAFSSFLSPNLQYDTKAATGYLRNQSEASNFIFIAPFLLLPSLYLVVRERRKGRGLLWGLLLINALILFFLARMFIPTPWFDPVYHLLLLDKVPHGRLLLGLGLAGVFQLLLLIKAMEGLTFKKLELRLLAAAGTGSALITMLAVGVYTIHHFPVFIASYAKMTLFALWVAFGILLILYKRFTAGLIVLALFSLLSVYRVHPLYQGLGSVTESPIAHNIEKYPQDSTWIVLNDRLLINAPLMTGRHTLNAVDFYPQLALWSELDKNRTYNSVYNRYAHVVFTDDPKQQEPFKLAYADMFFVKFEPCGTFLQRRHEVYVLSPKKLGNSCVTLQKQFRTPAKELFIYKITTPNQP